MLLKLACGLCQGSLATWYMNRLEQASHKGMAIGIAVGRPPDQTKLSAAFHD